MKRSSFIRGSGFWSLPAILLAIIWSPLIPAQPSASEAESLVTTYFNALVQGDTATIQGLLGGDLLESRKPLLDNPSYAHMLSTLYADATFEILGTKSLSHNNIAVDTRITLNPEEILLARFIISLAADAKTDVLKIIDEQEFEE